MTGQPVPKAGQLWFIFLTMLPWVNGTAQPSSESSLTKLTTQIQQTLDRYHIPGAGVALVADDSVIWQGGIGYAQLSSRKRITATTVFRVGSVSKTFTALALMRLVKAGQLKLEDEVQPLIPDVRIDNPWNRSKPVRVVHLLEHTAGFDDVYPAFLYQADQHPDATVRELISFGRQSLACRWPPGERYSYSNMGYIVAGHLVEKVSGQPFSDFTRDNVFRPLGMRHTTFRYQPNAQPALVVGHQINKQAAVAVPLRETCVDPSASLLTTPADFALYLLSALQAGSNTFLDSSLIRRMERPKSSLSARKGLSTGYGLGTLQQLTYPILFNGHKGAIYGYNAGYSYSTTYKTGFVVLLNGESIDCMFALDKIIKDHLTVRLQQAAPTASQPVGKSVIQRLSGYYQNVTPRFGRLAIKDFLLGGFTIQSDTHGLLLSSFLGPNIRLIALNDSVFQEEGKPVPSLLFTTNEGHPVLLSVGQYYIKAPFWQPWLWNGLILVALLISGLNSLSCLVNYLFRNRLPLTKSEIALGVSSFSLLAGVLLLGTTPDLFTLGTYSIHSVGYFIGTLAFAAFTAPWVFFLIRNWSNQPAKRNLPWGIANLFLLAFLLYWGVLGVKLWSY